MPKFNGLFFTQLRQFEFPAKTKKGKSANNMVMVGPLTLKIKSKAHCRLCECSGTHPEANYICLGWKFKLPKLNSTSKWALKDVKK